MHAQVNWGQGCHAGLNALAVCDKVFHVAIWSYRDKGTRDVAAGANSKTARRLLPVDLHDSARRKLAFLAAAQTLDDLRVRPGLNLHALGHERSGQHAVRINDQYRICFVWQNGDTYEVQITDYH